MVIQNSFIQLLKEKPINKITVKEICELADINRSTFYKYYLDPYDWIEQAERECLKTSQEVIDRIDSTDIEVLMTELFETIRANYEMFSIIFANHGNLLKEIFALYLEKAESRLKDTILQNPVGSRKWECYFRIYGCTGIIGCWIKDGMEQSPKEVASHIASLIK